MKFDHILLIGFGAPEKPEEIKPYLDKFAENLRIPAERLKEVERHYRAIGGCSPYNAEVLGFAGRLKKLLPSRHVELPVFLGMRNWNPFLDETMRQIRARGLKKGLGIILAPHRSKASFENYVESVEKAKEAADFRDARYEYLGPWFDDARFIESQREKTTQCVQNGFRDAHVLFSAHSIPLSMANASRYAEEVTESSRAVAAALGLKKWSVVYHSKSGGREEWLGPGILETLKKLAASGEKKVFFIPIGFLCENAEILYDLDIDAKKEAENLGIGYARAATVIDHPKITEMFADLVREAVHGN